MGRPKQSAQSFWAAAQRGVPNSALMSLYGLTRQQVSQVVLCKRWAS